MSRQASSRDEIAKSAVPRVPGESGIASLLDARDWSSTPLGPPDAWSEPLKNAAALCLTSRLPVALCWGPASTLICNDACAALFGGTCRAVPAGAPASQACPEIWSTFDSLVEQVRATGQGVLASDKLLSLCRGDARQEAHLTFSLSPVAGPHGRVDGVLCCLFDNTEGHVANRRLEALHALAIGAAETRSVEAACRKSAEVLARYPYDVPFAAIYLHDSATNVLALTASGGLGIAPALHAQIAANATDALSMQIAGGLREQRTLDLVALGAALPGGAWPEPARAAMALPIRTTAHAGTIGVLLAGISPRNASLDACAVFFRQVAAQIGAAVGDAQAYESERRRVKSLAELDRAKTTFFSNVSHEFRTPLTLLIAPLEEALATLPETPAGPLRALLDTARDNAQRLLKLVNALLDFARLEAGRVRARFRPTDLAAATAELASTFRAAIERAGLDLHVHCEPLPQAVWVDQEMWEKIVLNLLSNALKFTFHGRIDVALRADEGRAVLDVCDTGTGIAADELPHLFQRFHRIEGARSRSGEGSGIGLALVKELVHTHGGDVTVDSTPGAGSRFRVALPFGHAHLPADRIGPAEEQAPARPRDARLADEAMRWLQPADDGEAQPASDEGDDARARILVADDNAQLRDYLVRLLGARWTVEAVPDGEAALAAMRQRRFDLVLTDVMMPRLDGYGLLRVLRADPLLKATPVLMLSALAGEDDCVEGLQHGADDYLVKPFTAREVVARVGAHLKLTARRQLAAENAALIRLHEVSMRLASGDATPTLLQSVADAVVAVADAGMGVLQIVEPASGTLRVAAQCGFDADFVERLAGLGDVMPPRRERLIVEDLAQSALFAGTPVSPMLRAAGVRSIQSTPILARDGRLLGAVCTCWTQPHRPDEGVLRIIDLLAREAADLIEHHERDHALSETRATLQSFYDSSPFMMGVVEFDGDAPIGVYANSAALRFFRANGAAGDDFHGVDVSPPTRDLWLAQCRDSRRTGVPVRFEYEHADATVSRWLSATVAYLGAGREGRPRFSFVIEDITDRKRGERALLDADRRKDEFLAMLGHELRNPLLPIVAALEMIRFKGDDRFRREHETIEQQVRHVVRLVDDLLDVARIARGSIVLTRRRLSLHAVVAQAVEMVAPLIEERRHTLDVRVPHLPLEGDEARLAQVVANLLMNAAKYTHGGGRIAVRAWREGGEVVLEVRDNGIGIDAAALPRVFDLFSQARPGAEPGSTGLGLGLSIVRNLVALHGGTAHAASEGAGRGSIFTVRLPESDGDPFDAADAPRTALAAARRPYRILVIDDNDAARDGIAELLRAVGHVVFTAHDGESGLAVADDVRPDVAILDIGLPQMDGYEVARRLRARLGAAAPRLIALSGYGREPDRRRSFAAGFAIHLTKPLLDSLVETLDAWGREATDRSRD